MKVREPYYAASPMSGVQRFATRAQRGSVRGAALRVVVLASVALAISACSSPDDGHDRDCVAAGLSDDGLAACDSYCGNGCDRSVDGDCAAAREDFFAATGGVALPCDCEKAAADERDLLDSDPPPTLEPVERAVLAVPEGVDPDSVRHPIFHPDGDHLIWVGSLIGETGMHVMISRIDGSDYTCLTCPLGALPFAKPDVFSDGRRILVGNQAALGTPLPLPFVSPFADAETVPILECTPSLLDCLSAALVYVRVPYDPDDTALFANQRVREFRTAPDGVHIGWTQGRATVPLTLIPVIGELRREADHYELDNVEVLIDLSPALSARADGTYDFSLPLSGEIKRFTAGGAAVALFHPENAFNGDPSLVDLASGATRRLTRHPDYDEPVDISPDGRWLVVGSKRSNDPAFDVLAAFGLVERPAFVELAGSVLYSGWAFAGNGNRNRGLDTWLLDTTAERGDYIGQQLSDDRCYGGFERQHWNSDGTRVAKREQIRPQLSDAPQCQGIPAARVVVYELTSRQPIPPEDRIPAVSTPEVPWAVSITDVKSAPTVAPGVYVVRGRVFGEARVDLSAVGTAIAVEYDNYSDDGLQVLNGSEALALESQSVPYTADIEVSGCHTGFLHSDAALEGSSVTAVFGPLGGEASSRVADTGFEICAPGLPGIDSCRE